MWNEINLLGLQAFNIPKIYIFTHKVHLTNPEEIYFVVAHFHTGTPQIMAFCFIRKFIHRDYITKRKNIDFDVDKLKKIVII